MQELELGVAPGEVVQAVEGVLDFGGQVLGGATQIVPIEEGTLGRSGQTSTETQGQAGVGAVSFDTPYAVRQHEELDYRHDEGRSAKYLERPHTEAAGDGTAAAIAATELRKAFT